MREIYKILIVEDNTQDVKLMIRALDRAGFRHHIQQVSTKQNFLAALNDFEPDIILSDYTLPIFNGMHAFRLFKDKNLPIPFILVTGVLDENLAKECLGEGVDDFFIKGKYHLLPELLNRNLKMKALERDRQKLAEEISLKNEELKQLKEKVEKSRIEKLLSNRELEVLCLIAAGKSVKDIAEKLFLSPATIATYRARLLEKLDLKSNVELAQYALRNKLIE